MTVNHHYKIYESDTQVDRLWARLFQLEFRMEKLEKEIKKIKESEG